MECFNLSCFSTLKQNQIEIGNILTQEVSTLEVMFTETSFLVIIEKRD